MEKMMNKKTEGNTFTKKIGQTVYVVRYHFNEDAKQNNQTTTSNFPCNFNFTVSNMNRFNQGIDHG